MATFDSRLTGSLFLGDVDVVIAEDGVSLRGLRAPLGLSRYRIIGQWILAAAGVAAILLGLDHGLELLLAAPAFSFLAYLAMWWRAREHTVFVPAGADTEAATGWVFRWFDIFWFGNFVAAVALISSASQDGHRLVSFQGPDPYSRAGSARYILSAPTARAAAQLTLALLGPSD